MNRLLYILSQPTEVAAILNHHYFEILENYHPLCAATILPSAILCLMYDVFVGMKTDGFADKDSKVT